MLRAGFFQIKPVQTDEKPIPTTFNVEAHRIREYARINWHFGGPQIPHAIADWTLRSFYQSELRGELVLSGGTNPWLFGEED